MKQEDRYLTKVERFIKEEEFILTHAIEDNVTERALLYSLQVSVEISMEAISRIDELKSIVIKVAEH